MDLAPPSTPCLAFLPPPTDLPLSPTLPSSHLSGFPAAALSHSWCAPFPSLTFPSTTAAASPQSLLCLHPADSDSARQRLPSANIKLHSGRCHFSPSGGGRQGELELLCLRAVSRGTYRLEGNISISHGRYSFFSRTNPKKMIGYLFSFIFWAIPPVLGTLILT